FEFATSAPADSAADLLILPVFDGPEAGPGVAEVGKALGGDLAATFRENAGRRRLGDSLTVPTLGRLPSKTVLLVSLGKRREVTADAIRRAAGRAARTAARFVSVATTLPQATPNQAEGAAATVEGLALGAYRFDRFKTRNGDDRPDPSVLETVTLLG